MDKPKMKLKNTKIAKVTKTASSTRNRATQTMDSDDSLIEIVKLQKQIELLQLENDTLRKQTIHLETDKINIKVTICGCKGNCSSKRCRCVKENNNCTASCRCSSETCQNQEDQNKESGQEGKENISMNSMTTPEKQEELTQNKVAVKIKDNNLASDKIINHMEEFDPMKPRYQLSRTPPKKEKAVDEKIHMNNTQPHLSKSPQIIASSFNFKEDSSDLSDMEKVVDWMQHTAQLIPCKKCKRTFMPQRIKKHEACCKKV